MSDDFTRKMQAWEDKQRKRQSKGKTFKVQNCQIFAMILLKDGEGGPNSL